MAAEDDSLTPLRARPQRLSLALSTDPLVRIDLARPLAAQVPDGACVVLLKGYVWE